MTQLVFQTAIFWDPSQSNFPLVATLAFLAAYFGHTCDRNLQKWDDISVTNFPSLPMDYFLSLGIEFPLMLDCNSLVSKQLLTKETIENLLRRRSRHRRRPSCGPWGPANFRLVAIPKRKRGSWIGDQVALGCNKKWAVKPKFKCWAPWKEQYFKTH